MWTIAGTRIGSDGVSGRAVSRQQAVERADRREPLTAEWAGSHDVERENAVATSNRSKAESVPQSARDSISWLAEKVTGRRWLLEDAQEQPQRLADLAHNLHTAWPAGKNLVDEEGRQAREVIKRSVEAVNEWLVGGGFVAVLGREPDRFARRQAARISNRGRFIDLDEGVVSVMQDTLIKLMAGTATARGAFIDWGKDTSKPIRTVFARKLDNLPTECLRAYRDFLGLPVSPRIEGTSDIANWIAALKELLTTGPAVQAFEQSTGGPFRWPEQSEWNDPTRARAWAIRGWYMAFVDDASQTRPTRAADVWRIARQLHWYRQKVMRSVDDMPLPTLVEQHDQLWERLVHDCERLLMQALPRKHDQIESFREATTSAGQSWDDVRTKLDEWDDDGLGAFDDDGVDHDEGLADEFERGFGPVGALTEVDDDVRDDLGELDHVVVEGAVPQEVVDSLRQLEGAPQVSDEVFEHILNAMATSTPMQRDAFRGPITAQIEAMGVDTTGMGDWWTAMTARLDGMAHADLMQDGHDD